MHATDDDDNFMSLLLDGKKERKLSNGTAAVFLSPHVERINSIFDFYTQLFFLLLLTDFQYAV